MHLRLAHELGIHLHELMGWYGPMTARQFAVWQAWLQLQWESPSRSDQYLMQIAAEVRRTPSRVWGKEPAVELQDMRLKFGNAPGEQQFRSREEAAIASKARWAGYKALAKRQEAAPMSREDQLALEVRKRIKDDKLGAGGELVMEED